MPNTYTAVVKQDGDWWIGWVEEVPGVNCQGKTREELLESLSITLKEALEFNYSTIYPSFQRIKKRFDMVSIYPFLKVSPNSDDLALACHRSP
jgi:predicted RNase H-like HicB family nuclease